jgi:hypothetical protein
MLLNSVRRKDAPRIIVWSECPRNARIYLLINSVRGPVDPSSIVRTEGLCQRRRNSDLPTKIFDIQTLDLSRREGLVGLDLLIHTVGRNPLEG